MLHRVVVPIHSSNVGRDQQTPTKIIDGCQEIITILADKKTAVAQHAAMQYG